MFDSSAMPQSNKQDKNDWKSKATTTVMVGKSNTTVTRVVGVVTKQPQQSQAAQKQSQVGKIAASEEYNYALSQKSIKQWRPMKDGDGGGDEYDEYNEDDGEDEEDEENYVYGDNDDEHDDDDDDDDNDHATEDGDTETADESRPRRKNEKTSSSKCECSANISRVKMNKNICITHICISSKYRY